MAQEPVRIRESTSVDLSLKNLVSIVLAVAIGVWAYFGIQERLNKVETNIRLMVADLEKNTNFRILWPRGELGALPDDSEQFMLIEHMQKTLDQIQDQQSNMLHNTVNIDRLQTDMLKAQDNIELLKDKVRANGSQ